MIGAIPNWGRLGYTLATLVVLALTPVIVGAAVVIGAVLSGLLALYLCLMVVTICALIVLPKRWSERIESYFDERGKK